jgi:hypothetical protein
MSERLSSIGPETTVVLAIDQHGKVTEVRSPFPPDDSKHATLAAALRDVPFLPALLEGKPVDSKGTFAIYEFTR